LDGLKSKKKALEMLLSKPGGGRVSGDINELLDWEQRSVETRAACFSETGKIAWERGGVGSEEGGKRSSEKGIISWLSQLKESQKGNRRSKRSFGSFEELCLFKLKRGFEKGGLN